MSLSATMSHNGGHDSQEWNAVSDGIVVLSCLLAWAL